MKLQAGLLSALLFLGLSGCDGGGGTGGMGEPQQPDPAQPQDQSGGQESGPTSETQRDMGGGGTNQSQEAQDFPGADDESSQVPSEPPAENPY